MLVCLIVAVLMLLLVLIHVIACVWYWIQADPPDGDLDERYVQSYHFVLALFMGEQLDPAPSTLPERVFTVIVLVFAFIISAFFVGSLTTAMTRLQMLASQRSAQFAALDRYLSDNGVSRELAVRVQLNARHALREQFRKTPESSVELLKLISGPLRAEIHYETHLPVLAAHPFLRLYNSRHAVSIRHVCHKAVAQVSLSRGDVLFSESEITVNRRMFFVCDGKFMYLQDVKKEGGTEVVQGCWLSEAVLWTAWTHRGTLQAVNEGSLLALNAEEFAGIVSTFPTVHVFNYAAKFVQGLNDSSCDDLTDIGEEVKTREWASAVFAEFARPSIHETVAKLRANMETVARNSLHSMRDSFRSSADGSERSTPFDGNLSDVASQGSRQAMWGSLSPKAFFDVAAGTNSNLSDSSLASAAGRLRRWLPR